jgi:hypothetical protein
VPAQVSKLIAKLKREMPELKDNPILDEIETAAYGSDEEAAPADDAEAADAEPTDEDLFGDEEAPAEDDEALPELEEEEPAPAPKKPGKPSAKRLKLSKMPFM